MSSEAGERIDASTVRFVRLLPGPIERVWLYLVDGEKRRLWLCGGDIPAVVGASTGMHFDNASLSDEDDIEPPERFRDLPAKMSFEGRVTACDPPRLIAHTWLFEGQESEVTFELEEVGDKVRLVLTHRELASDDEVLETSGGWHTHLETLAARLERRKRPPFWETHALADALYRERFEL